MEKKNEDREIMAHHHQVMAEHHEQLAHHHKKMYQEFVGTNVNKKADRLDHHGKMVGKVLDNMK